VLAAVATAARLPQLLGPNLLLDGDECIVGLMGAHVLRGHEFPLFMYGQRYGLAVVEAPLLAVSFALLGVGAVPLKLAILALWVAGVLVYFRAFARVLGDARSFWIALLFALMPAWADASMKAWSGYVTAFTATAVAIDLMMGEETARARRRLASGIATGMVFLAQPLWLPGLAPIALYVLSTRANRRGRVAYAAGAIGAVGLVVGLRALWPGGGDASWSGPAAGNAHLLASLPPLVRQIYVSLTGSFYLGNAVAPGSVTAVVAWIWMLVLGAASLAQIYRIAVGRYRPWSHVLFASVILTVAANWILLEARDGRYMLPLAMPLVFLAGVELFDLADRGVASMRGCVVVLAMAAVVHAAAVREFGRQTFMWWTNAPGGPSESATLQKVVGAMRARGVRRAYAMNPLLQWTITFYSDEAVIARWKAARDRYPPYIEAADAALAAGEPIAIVGYTGYTYGLERQVRDPEAMTEIDGKYFVYVGADRAVLQQAGFRLTR
jgi:hypothetical protein